MKKEIVRGIYKIKSKTSGKVYIGQSKDLYKRIDGHKNLLKNNKHSNKHLQRSYNIYGIDDFTYEIIEICNEENIDEKEIYWINHYNSCDGNFGYNSESGGNKNKIVSIETRKKISVNAKLRPKEQHPMFGKPRPLETRVKLSEANKGTVLSKETRIKIGLGNKNKIVSQETRLKMSIAAKGRICSNETKLKMSNACKGEKNHNYGVKQSSEHIQKRIENQIKLTQEQAIEIREKYFTGNYEQKNLAKEYFTSESTISKVVNYKSPYKKTSDETLVKMKSGFNKIKLNQEQITEIREKYSTGKYSYSKLAKEYFVAISVISNVVNFKLAYKEIK